MSSQMIVYIKQGDGCYAVKVAYARGPNHQIIARGSAGKLLGFVGRDASGWWASHSASNRGGNGVVASAMYVNAMPTRDAAVNALIEWGRAVTS